jgi:hypothetical protein
VPLTKVVSIVGHLLALQWYFRRRIKSGCECPRVNLKKSLNSCCANLTGVVSTAGGLLALQREMGGKIFSMIALGVDDVDGHSTTSYLQLAPMDKDLPTFFVAIAEIIFFDLKSTLPLS